MIAYVAGCMLEKFWICYWLCMWEADAGYICWKWVFEVDMLLHMYGCLVVWLDVCCWKCCVVI